MGIDRNMAKELFAEEVARLLKKRGVVGSYGPPMAYFTTVGSGVEKRFTYVAHSVKGIKQPGESGGISDSLFEAISETIRHFDKWLRPGLPLLWRDMPDVDFENGQWATYMRCIQLDAPTDKLIIEWNL